MLRTTSCILPLVFCLVPIGCNSKTSAPPISTPTSSSAPSVGEPAREATRPDLSVPRLAPKPVVWHETWQPVASEPESATRLQAQALMSRADRLKSIESFAEAEKAYQQAMAADPTWAYPAYQLACNYELWDQHDRAVESYTKAVELGFEDFPTALTDDELGRIRNRPDFDATLSTIRARYVASSQNRVGQPIAMRPSDAQPPAGWPMMLLLHGYGDTNLNYLDFAEDWSKLGFVTVAVPGTVPSRSGRFQWAAESTDPTDQDLQAIIQAPIFDGLVNREKVFLLGFSQGALHAMLLAAEQPERYAGVAALSPGGSLAARLNPPPLNRSQRPGCVVFIHGTEEPHAPYVRIWSQACQAAGWKFSGKTHPGGHHFPDDWDTMRPEIAKFLTE